MLYWYTPIFNGNAGMLHGYIAASDGQLMLHCRLAILRPFKTGGESLLTSRQFYPNPCESPGFYLNVEMTQASLDIALKNSKLQIKKPMSPGSLKVL